MTARALKLVYNETLIHDRGEMLCLTDMWRAEGKPSRKDPAQWRRLPGSGGFIRHIGSIMGLSHDDLFEVVRGGSAPETWAHWQIAMAYAQYLSDAFHVWCNQVVRAHMEGRGNSLVPASPLTLDGIRAVFDQGLAPVHSKLDEHSSKLDEHSIVIKDVVGNVIRIDRRLDDLVPRHYFPASIVRQYLQTVLVYYDGMDPMNRRIRIVNDDGTKTDELHIHHFRGREMVGVEDGFPTSIDSHKRIHNDAAFKEKAHAHFKVFHDYRRELFSGHSRKAKCLGTIPDLRQGALRYDQ